MKIPYDEGKTTPMVATDGKYDVVASFLSSSKSMCTPDMGIVRIRGPPKTTASFRRWTPWTDTDKQAGAYLSAPRASPLSSHTVS